MNLTLYKNLSSDNTINKTLADALVISINLKSDTNIVSPVLVLSVIEGVDFTDFNYCYIDVLNRFYFIQSIDSVNNKIVRLVCECDYIETYKNDILSSNARFNRNLKTGDFLEVNLDTSVIKDVELFNSDSGFDEGSSMILTTVGG